MLSLLTVSGICITVWLNNNHLQAICLLLLFLHCIVPGHFPPYNAMHARGGLPNFALPLVFNGPGGALGLTACADGVGCKVFMALNGWLPMDSLTETELLKHG